MVYAHPPNFLVRALNNSIMHSAKTSLQGFKVLNLLGFILLDQYSVLIFVDLLRGMASIGVPATWYGTIALLYGEEWLFWFIIPVVTMLWWRSWAKKHRALLEQE